MATTDSIGDMLTIIRNGLRAKFPSVEFHSSKLKLAIVKVLREEGYISSYEEFKKDELPYMKVTLKYGEFSDERVIHEINRVSKPGRRVYVSKKRIPKVLNGFGITILSTPRGVLTGRQARMANVGGELLCEVF